MLATIVVFLLSAASLHAADVFTPPKLKGMRGTGDAVGTGAIPLPSPKQKWIAVDSPHFHVVSSASAARTREMTENLETLAAALTHFDERFGRSATRTRVFIFARREEVRPMLSMVLNRPGTGARGAFVSSGDDGGTMLLDAGSDWRLERTPFHELVHDLLAAGGARPPHWMEEGLAEYFSAARVGRERVEVGVPIREHLSLIRRGSLIPIDTLLAAKRTDDLVAAPRFYAQSWAAVDWLIRRDRNAFLALMRDLESGTDVTAALSRHFGLTVPLLERAVFSSRLYAAPADTSTLPAHGAAVTSAPLSRADALVELGRFLGTLESRRADAERFLRTALAEQPGHARSLAALAWLRTRSKEWDAAMPLFEQAIAADPSDSAIRLEYAAALLRDALGPFAGSFEPGRDDRERFRRARALTTDDGIVGTSYLAEEDVRPGIAPLTRAHERSPARADYALNLLTMHLRVGNRAEADALYAKLANARDPQTAFAARAILVRERLAETNRLVQAHKIEDAIRLVDEMIAATPDPAGKLHLELQKRDLAALAETNQQILAYNRAVAEANRGNRRAALKIVDELLKVATDAQVREYATELRKRLTR